MLDKSLPENTTQETPLGSLPSDWEVLTLGEVCSQICDGTHFTPTYVEAGVPFYSVENVTRRDFENVKYISHQEHASLIRRCKPEKGDILMTRIGSIADTTLIDWDVDASIYVSLALLKVNNRADPTYIYSYSKSQAFILGAESRSLMNAAPKKINMGEIASIPLAVPTSKIEQAKIAEALSDADALIEGLEKLIAKKRLIKQGAMQELLTGKRRLPGFSGEWDEKQLGDLFEITSSKRVFQNQWKPEGVPFFRAREIAELVEVGRVDNALFIDRSLYESFKASYGVPLVGDMLVTGVGTLGKAYVVKEGDEFYFKDGNIIWFKIHSKLCAEFLQQLYLTPQIMEQITGGSAGTTVGTYTITAAKRTKIVLPSISEQSAIAAVLVDMDADISTYQAKLAKARQIKQGMMQELLTGRIRLV